MVSGEAKLVIDLGNSETRVKTIFGKNAKGDPKCRLSFLRNRFGIIPSAKVDMYRDGNVYKEETSRIFKLDEDFYCTGDICDTEFGSTAIRPTALEKKYQSFATKLAIINALCQGYEDVAYLTDSDIASLDITWKVTLLLPPQDIDLGAKKLAEMAKGIKEIEFLMPDIKKEIIVNGVNIFPEGFCALIGVLFDESGSLREEYKKLTDEDTYTLIIDIGAGTTDFVMSKGKNIISTSRFTREIGGNNVHQRVRRILKEKGLSLSDTIVRKGCETGVVKNGSKAYNITKDIAVSKADVAKQLVDAIQEFFEDNMLPIISINNLLICGGGAEYSENQEIEPISKYVIEYMKQLSPEIELVDIPEVLVNDESKKSPRLLNILGAGVLSTIDN